MRIKKYLFIITAVILSLFVYGCKSRNIKYDFQLKDLYKYNELAGVFYRESSDFNHTDKEFFVIRNGKVKYLKATPLKITVPSDAAAENKNITFNLCCVYNDGKLCISSPLSSEYNFNYIQLPADTDIILFWYNQHNVYSYNMKTNYVTEIFDNDFNYLEIISVSPDGNYVLYRTTDSGQNELYSVNTATGEETFLMNYDGREFLSWQKDTDDCSVLFRETVINETTGESEYSDIQSCSVTTAITDAFYLIPAKYRNYRILDDDNIYYHLQNRYIYIYNIYTDEIITFDTGEYDDIYSLSLSKDKKYISCAASYLGHEGDIITNIVTFHLETNDIRVQSSIKVNNFMYQNHYWSDDNYLAVNFTDTLSDTNFISQYFYINHRYSTPSLFINDTGGE